MLPMSRSSTFLLASLRQCRASLLSSCSTKLARAVTLQPEPEVRFFGCTEFCYVKMTPFCSDYICKAPFVESIDGMFYIKDI